MEWRIYSCRPTSDRGICIKKRNLSSRKWDPIKIQQFQAYPFESIFDLNQMRPDDKLLIFMEDAVPNVKIRFCQFGKLSWNLEIQFVQRGNTGFFQWNQFVISLVHKIHCPVVGSISEVLFKMKYWEDVWALSTCVESVEIFRPVLFKRLQNEGKPKQLIACKLPIFLSRDDKLTNEGSRKTTLCHWQIVNRNSTFSNHICWIQNTKLAIDKNKIRWMDKCYSDSNYGVK